MYTKSLGTVQGPRNLAAYEGCTLKFRLVMKVLNFLGCLL